MKRLLFFLRAYNINRQWKLLLLLGVERFISADSCRKFFSLDLIESRSLLGFIFDKEGKALAVEGGMLVNFFCNSKVICIHLRWQSSDFLAFQQVFINQEYKRLTTLKCVSPVIVDAGANIGCTTLFLESFYPDANILAIEPDEQNFKALTKNVKLNRLKNVRVIRAAVWYENGHVSLSNDYRDNRQWSIRVSTSGKSLVESKTLQQILVEAGVSQMNILKMDIEGAELRVFKFDETIVQSLVSTNLVGIEVHEDERCVNQKLIELGFRCSIEGETLFAEKKIEYDEC